MVILVNAHSSIPAYAGAFSKFLQECFSRIISTNGDDTFIFLTSTTSFPLQFPELKNVFIIPFTYSPGSSFLSRLVLKIKITKLIKKYGVDLYLSDNMSYTVPDKCNQYVFVHDSLKIKDSKSASQETPLYLRKAGRIGVFSNHTKEQLLSKYSIPADHVDTLYCGVDDGFFPMTFEQKEAIKNDTSNGNEYFFVNVGVPTDRDLLNSLKAFSQFKKRQKSSMYLLFLSRNGQYTEAFKALLQTYKYRDEVKLLNDISDSELCNITAGAYAIVFPSEYGTYGMPVIEAMRSNVPVLTINTLLMQELVGDAALYFDICKPDSISAKMQLIFKDEQLRQLLVLKGHSRVQSFNWENTSALLWRGIKAATTF